MIAEVKYRGLWWLPDKPDQRIAGELSLVPYDEAYLELQDALDADVTPGFRLSLLHGMSGDGDPITLLGCLLIYRRGGVIGQTTLRFQIHHVYVGYHFAKPEDIRFRAIRARYVNFHEWLEVRNFDFGVEQNSNVTHVRHETSEPVNIRFENYTIELVADLTSSFSMTQVVLTEDAQVFVRSDSDEGLDAFLELLNHFQDFLSLAIGAPTFPIEVMGLLSQVMGDDEQYEPVMLYFPARGFSREPKVVHFSQMLFTLPAVRENLETYLGNWIRITKQFKAVSDLYFASLYNPQQYIEATFINLTQALEVYHRRKYGGKYQTDEEYKENLYKNFVEAIPPDLDPSFRTSLVNGKLKYANEYSLRRRLHEIVREITVNMPIAFLASSQQRNEFVEKICGTRNYLTHYTEELEIHAPKIEDLHALTVRLQILLKICLLRELGFDYSLIATFVSKGDNFLL